LDDMDYEIQQGTGNLIRLRDPVDTTHQAGVTMSPLLDDDWNF